MTPVRILLVSGLLLLSGGCFLSKKPAVVVPVAVPATPSPAPAASAPPRQLAAPSPPPPAAASQPTTPAPEPAKPSPFPDAPPATASQGAAPVRPKPAPVAPVPTPTPAPALGVILTADQKKQLDTTYQSDLRQANAVLNGLNGRTLTPGQTDTVSRARAFIRQAAQYHDRDLTTAAELARRARLLTQDLAGTLK